MSQHDSQRFAGGGPHRENRLRLTTPTSPPLLPILSVAFVGSLGFSIVLPFLVFLVTRLGGNALVYGAIGATYSAFQLTGAPILGKWSDRFGRRRILLLSQVGTLASWLIFLGALYLPVNPSDRGGYTLHWGLHAHASSSRALCGSGARRAHGRQRLGGERLFGRCHDGE